MVVAAPHRPPELLDAGSVLLRRHTVDDAPGLARAIEASLDELRPWMPWATHEACDPGAQQRRLEAVVPLWDQGVEFAYLITEEGSIIGGAGLHARSGPGSLEIGYWLRSDRTGRGIATAAARTLTAASLALPGIERVEIHCDRANRRSAAVPARLGYRLDRTEAFAVGAPADSGSLQIWVWPTS